MKVKVLLDRQGYIDKQAAKADSGKISGRISGEEITIEVSELAHVVGDKGYTFSPAVYGGRSRKQENFSEIQLFGIDIDKGISYKEITDKCKRIGLPVLFSYHTLSSSSAYPKYRLVFSHIVPITNSDIAKSVLGMLKTLFPEADGSCFELARMFFGGKKLIEVNDDATFRIDVLANKFQECLYIRDKTSYIRNLSRFAKQYNIGYDKFGLRICTYQFGTSEGEMAEKMGNCIKDIIPIPQSSAQIVVEELKDRLSTSTVSSACVPERLYIEKIAEGKLISVCRLYRDLREVKYLPHGAKFLLATNLRFLKGYKKRFFRYLHQYDNDENYIKRWEYQWRKIERDYKYNPENCNPEDCPYYDRCIHEKNIVSTVIGRRKIVHTDNEKYVTLNEAYIRTRNSIYEAVEKVDKDIHLIKAQTGIGKTHIYTELVRSGKLKFIIAVPTVKLKREISWKLGDIAVEVVSLQELLLPDDVREKVELLYSRGLHKEARKYIAHYAKDLPDGFYAKEQCMDYLKYKEKLRDGSKSIIMTHAQLLNLNYEDTNGYIVLVDEDILLTVLRDVKAVSVSDLEAAVSNGLITGVKAEELKQILKEEKGRYQRSIFQDRFSYINEEEMDKAAIDEDINSLLQAGSYYLDKNNGMLNYFVPKKVPEQKIIVMSATLDYEIYKAYFSNRKIHIYDIPKVLYKGRVIQYSFYSMSRRNISELESEGWKKETLLNDMLDMTEERIDYGISFKEWDNLLQKKLPMEPRHFGNSAGTDIYCGKNGIIIGTPHLREESYKLIACYLGIDVNEKVCIMKRITVDYNGFQFFLMSYKNPLLREIQLYMISSELEQSIGRSRLLRNDAKVFVFSNFPCEQAILHQEEYLTKDIADSEWRSCPRKTG